ncbi:C-C motif chemokine 1 [Tupaia chinensis]|uniref:C-C motif chemokine 1 n=1 Tax=Tupaia chinensis TaxID=246437 RepID=L9KG57_TUPCH|nr:C-C motif chemokine 1 [Tupaia chinensis]ELW61711.1 C-C motif chemokine 1 [Tupaia chinensis]
MKLHTMALMCLLLVGTWPQDVDSKSMHVPSSNCCFSFVKRKISPEKIQCYRNSSSTCSYRSVKLKMKKGREICALENATQAWGYLDVLKPCPPKAM